MESHPVPQNVTAFEFHLVGNMTLRQFGYLAIGLIIAYISFLLFFNTLPLLAWPLIIIPSLVGAAYAFLPIMERPLDYWTKAFIKAIRRPTFRKYSSKVVSPEDPKFKERLDIYLHFLQTLPATFKKPDLTNPIGFYTPTQVRSPAQEEKPKSDSLPENESKDSNEPDAVSEFISNLNRLATQTSDPNVTKPPVSVTQQAPISGTNFASQPSTNPTLEVRQPMSDQPLQNNTPLQRSPLPPHPSSQPVITEPNPNLFPNSFSPQSSFNEPIPSEQDLDKTVALARQAQMVQIRILEAEKQINDIKSGAATQGMDPKKYTEQFQAVLSDLQKLNQKARDISHNLAELSRTQNMNPLSAQPASKPNIIPTLTLTSTANIINGIVTDAQGNYIEGAIIVAHDKAGLPVRALKTNKLGQFIAATPLPSGTYTISVEKDDLGFDVIQVDLDEKILNPVVISAKKGMGQI